MELPQALLDHPTFGKPFYLLVEDLAAALIGPFSTFDEVVAHQQFRKERGDSAEVLGVYRHTDLVLDAREYAHIELTPEEDREERRICSACSRPMTPEECGDETPEERVCDDCAGL